MIILACLCVNGNSEPQDDDAVFINESVCIGGLAFANLHRKLSTVESFEATVACTDWQVEKLNIRRFLLAPEMMFVFMALSITAIRKGRARAEIGCFCLFIF